MRRWIAWAARLYPRDWRERYGAEFDALLEDAPADWRQLWNVTRKALAMQFAANALDLKIIGAVTLAGALVAAVAAYRVPPRYVSSAVIRIVSSGQSVPPAMLERETGTRFERLRGYLTSYRPNIKERLKAGLRVAPERLLWRDLEEPIRTGGEIQVEPLHLRVPNGIAFRVSFAYSDRRQAQDAVRQLITVLAKDNDSRNQLEATMWSHYRQAMKEHATNEWHWKPAWSDEFPITVRLDPVESADLPSLFAERRRTVLAAAGCAAGLLLGVLGVLFRRRPKLALRVVTCGLAGCALAAALSSLIEVPYTAKALVRETDLLESPAEFYNAAALTPITRWASKAWDNLMDDETFWKGLRNPQLGFDEAKAAQLYQDRRHLFQSRHLESHTDDIPGATFEMSFRHPDKRIANWVIFQVQQQLSRHSGGSRTNGLSLPPNVVQARYDWQLILAGMMIGILFALIRRTDHLTSINGESSLSL
jgi:hypothetical protein